MKTVLVVGMAASVHMARFCAAIDRSKWQVVVFPCHDAPAHPALADVVLLDPSCGNFPSEQATVALTRRAVLPNSRFAARERVRALALAAVIRTVRPDLIHAQELQHGGYLTAAASALAGRMPPVVSTIWGADLSLRARVASDVPRLRRVLAMTKVLISECDRDEAIARQIGFEGRFAGRMAVAGGLDLDSLMAHRQPGPTSARKVIAIKGYQGWAGRAQVALRALELVVPALAGYEVVIFAPGGDIAILADRLARSSGIKVSLLAPPDSWVPHADVLALQGRSRVSVGLSMADGASTSFLEAMAMGSFPIQSCTACADEWIVDGEGGLIVPPEDPEAVAQALARALGDDELVDRAALTNEAAVRTRLSDVLFRQQLASVYDLASGGRDEFPN